jgi:serine/threonine protein kinase/tetratricopeptide (TPR) repeat protein
MTHCSQCGLSLQSALDRGGAFCEQCGFPIQASTTDHDPLIGQTLQGQYRLLEMVGWGGMGRVYRGEQTNLGRTVAIKVVHPHLVGDPQTVARFYTEARAASRLNHPNSVSIIDFGRTAQGVLYLVMEYLTGKDLARILEEQPLLPFSRITSIMMSVLSALSEAHEQSVVHRDLKPENILVKRLKTGDDLVKVVDFGLAALRVPGATSITNPGFVCGTPDYMAPEQARGEQVDGRSDLYSLGVVLFELLTGQLPYVDETPMALAMRHIHDPIPDPRRVAPTRAIPDTLAEITLRALAKSPSDRFADADDMKLELERAYEGLRTGTSPRMSLSPASSWTPSLMPHSGSAGSARPSLTPRSRMPWSRSSEQFYGRDQEVADIEHARALALQATQICDIVGPVGAGKTALLYECVRRAMASGDGVVHAGPHPSGAHVAYSPIRELLAGLFGVAESELRALALDPRMQAWLDTPLARAGLDEIVEPSGIPGLCSVLGVRGKREYDRTKAAAIALHRAVRWKLDAGGHARLVLCLDDVYDWDELSQATLRELCHSLQRAHPCPPVLVLRAYTQQAGKHDARHDAHHTIRLGGVDSATLHRLLRSTALTEALLAHAPLDRDAITPLYVEQVRARPVDRGSADESLPMNIADAVLVRMERMDAASRKLLHAISVLGLHCTLHDMEAMTPSEVRNALHDLVQRGWLSQTDDVVAFNHPFVREVIEASIPSEARKTLHAIALDLATARGERIEVQAHHAAQANVPFRALLLLERAAEAAFRQGDRRRAMALYRQGLEYSRRWLVEHGDETIDGATLTFSRKLAEVLDVMGHANEASGVLNEMLDHAPVHSRERAYMLAVLARIAMNRERYHDAHKWLEQAMAIFEHTHDALGQVTVHLTRARISHAQSDAAGGVAHYERALLLLHPPAPVAHSPQSASQEVSERTLDALLGKADALFDQAQWPQARQALEQAIQVAHTCGLAARKADALAALGSLCEIHEDPHTARSYYRDAALHAAEAGDADGAERWQRAAQQLGAGTQFPPAS